MQESTHTPGPWHLSTGSCGSPHMISWEPKKTYGHIASVPTPSFQELPEAKSTMERLANARLIAAAPDLLAQVKEYRQLLVTLAMQGEETSSELEAVDQVIRKAEGGE